VIFLSALGTEAPKDDLSLLDDKSVCGGRLQAGCRADSAVHICGHSAAATDEVVVIIAHPPLIAAWVAGRLDSSHKPRFLQDVQVVIHGLGGERTQLLTGGFRDGFRVPVLSCAQNGREDGQAGRSHPQACLPKGFVKWMCVRKHTLHYNL